MAKFCLNKKDKSVQKFIERVGERDAAAIAESIAQDEAILVNKDVQYQKVRGSYKPSNLYNALLDKSANDSIEAFQSYLDMHSPEFIKEHGDWTKGEGDLVLDENGEPKGNFKIQEYAQSDKVRDPYIELGKEMHPVSREKDDTVVDYNKKKDKLTKLFKDQGVNVNVKVDTSMEDIARVDQEGEDINIKINIDKARRDSLYHEFGHILVDFLGYDDPLIKQGIELLEGTQLYKKVHTVYTKRYEGRENLKESIDKEALTWAIGLKAAKIYDSKNGDLIARFTYWLNRFYDKIAGIFGVERDAIHQLADNLVNGGKHINRLNNSVKVEEMAQVAMKDIQEATKSLDFLVERTNDQRKQLMTHASIKKGSELLNITRETHNDLLDSVNDLLEDDKDSHLLEALLLNFKFDTANIVESERILDNIQTRYGLTDPAELPFEEQMEISRNLNAVREFIAVYVKVKTLNVIPDKLDDELSDTQKEIKVLIDKIKNEYHTRADTIGNTFDDLIMKHIGVVLAYNKDPKAKFDHHKLIHYGEDITRAQYLMDGLMDANNPLAVLYKKFYTIHFGKAETKVLQIERKFYNKLKAYFGVKTLSNVSEDTYMQVFNKMQTDDGRFVREFDYDKFWKAQRAYAASAKQIAITEIEAQEAEGTVYPAKNKAIEKRVNAKVREWYRINTTTLKNDIQIAEIIETNKASMTKFEYTTWLEKNFKLNKYNEYTAKIGSEFRQPSVVYIDGKYAAMSPKEFELYTYITNLLKEQTTNYGDSIVNEWMLPGVSKPGTKPVKDTYIEDDERLMDVTGEDVWDVPFFYSNLINQKKVFAFPRQGVGEDAEQYSYRTLLLAKNKGFGSFNTLAELKDYNKSIKEENDKAHTEALERNLKVSIPKYIKSAVMYRAGKEIESEMKLGLSIIKNADYIKKNGLKEDIKDFAKRTKSGDKEIATVKGIETNIYARFKKDLEMVYYGMFTQEGKYNEVLSAIKTYTAYKGLAFNPFSAVKNVTYGSIMTAMEAASGTFFNGSDLAKGVNDYRKGGSSYYVDARNGDTSSSTIQNAIMQDYNVLYSQNELNNEVNGITSTRWYAKRMRNVTFLMQETGEHVMQQGLLLTMLESHRIVDGKILNESDYVNRHLKQTKLFGKKVENDKIIADNKGLEKKLKAEFQIYTKMRDIYELSEDGYSDIKSEFKDKVSQTEIEDFKIRIKGVNHKMHGIYNPSDKGAGENQMLFQNLMQFRHWARPGWSKRFGSRKDPFFNQRRHEIDRGDYRSFFKLITIPFTEESKHHWTNKTERAFLETAVAIIQGYLSYFTNARVYWHNMQPHEKQGVIRTAIELLSIAGMFVLLQAMRGLADDDDDLANSWWFNFMLYELDALSMELRTYTPIGWANEGSKLMANPMATWGTIFGSVKLLNAALMYPINDFNGVPDSNYFQGGSYNNQSKVGVYTQKMIPGWTQIQRAINLESNNRYYKLWN